MKKFITAILAVLFISTSMGMTVHMHYCMDKLVAVKLWHTDKQDDACSNCGMKKGSKKGCCKDEHKVVKTDNYQKTDVTQIPVFENFPLSLPPQPFALDAIIYASRVKQLPYSNAPPDRSTVPIYIRNCVYRI